MDLLCRTCMAQLSDDALDTTKFDIFNTGELLLQLNTVLHAEFELHDELPKNLCNICYKKVQDAYEFIKQSLESIQKLREMQKVKNEVFFKEETIEFMDNENDFPDDDFMASMDEDEEEYFNEEQEQAENVEEIICKPETEFHAEVEPLGAKRKTRSNKKPTRLKTNRKTTSYKQKTELNEQDDTEEETETAKAKEENLEEATDAAIVAFVEKYCQEKGALIVKKLPNDKQKYVCKYCPKTYVAQHSLVAHQRKEHEGYYYIFGYHYCKII